MATTSSRNPRPGSPRSFLGRLISLILVRAELFSLEVEEHKEALIGQIVLALFAFAALFTALLSALLLIALLTPAAARPLLFGIITVVALCAGLLAVLALRRKLRRQTAPFALTLGEVRKDLQTLLGTGGSSDDQA